jgi:hypothetical protein
MPAPVPAEGIHLTALREAQALPTLDTSVRRRLVRRDDAARLGALLVDFPYFDRFAGEVVRYLLGVPARPSPWGAALHEGAAIALLTAILRAARQARDEALGAIGLGLASHLAMDRALHPLINALARKNPVGRDHGSAHREVEKFQSICFHEQYFGKDLMGTPTIQHYLTLHLAPGLERSELGAPIRAAFEAATGRPLLAAELARFGRGYRAHTRLLGSPLGKRIAPAADKERARPTYLHGGWGTFESHLAAAVAASVAVINAAGAVLDADAADEDAAFAALARVLPPGTIDGAGDDVDLASPFRVALPTA